MRRGFLANIAYTDFLWGTGLVLLLLAALENLYFTPGDISLAQTKVFGAISGFQILGITISNMLDNTFANHLMRFLFLLGTSFVLQHISSEFRLIRVRSFFPFFLFCVLSATILPDLPLDGASLACLFFSLFCLRLFNSLDPGQKYRAVFDASVFLALASVFQSRLLFLMPVIWLVMGILQVLDFKTFLSSILGMFSIFWIIGGICFLSGDYSFLLAYLKDLINFKLIDFTIMSPAEISNMAFLAILILSAITSFWPRQHLDKLRTRNYLNSVLLLWFALLVLWLFSANDMGYGLPLLSLSALVIAHFFSLVDTLYSRFMFFVFIGLSATVFFLL